MADALLDKVWEVAEGQIDFEGQKLSELLATALLSIVGALAFILGYILQDIKLALIVGLGGTALTFLLIVPPWPFLQRHPVKWLPVAGSDMASGAIFLDSKIME